MTVHIRSATVRDGPALERIEQACFTHDQWTAQEFLKFQCRVAEVDGEVVGFVVGQDVFSGLTGQRREHEILNLAVLTSHRGLGIARALLEDELNRGGLFYLEVRESNSPAIRLYQKLGFAEVGRRANYYESPREHAIVMRLQRC